MAPRIIQRAIFQLLLARQMLIHPLHVRFLIPGLLILRLIVLTFRILQLGRRLGLVLKICGRTSLVRLRVASLYLICGLI